MKFKHYVPYVLLSVSSITFATSKNFETQQFSPEIKETIQELLQNNGTFEELLQFIEDLENGTSLEEKYELKEINDFLASIAKLGSLIKNSQEAQILDESIDDLYEEIEDSNYLTQSGLPSWYQDVYFPNQLAPLNIQTCGFDIGKTCKKAGKGVKKGAKKTVKFTKKRIKEIAKVPKKVEKGIRKTFKKSSKKSWEKTKKFIKKHKKAIIIGLVVITIVTLTITLAPEISTLLASLIPASTDDDTKNSSHIAEITEEPTTTYTEDNFVEDCIELVQEDLLASGIDRLPIENTLSSSVLEYIKGFGSMVSHQLIDAVDTQLQHLNSLTSLPEQLHELIPNLPTINQSEESLFANGAKIAMAYLHQKTDKLFDTSLAALYTEEAKALSEQLGTKPIELMAPLPLPGKSGGANGNKNVLRKFTENNYRKNLKKTNPHPDYAIVDAHHVFPQALKKDFEKFGINVHDPQYLTWWGKSEHRSLWHEYETAWRTFFRDNKNVTREQILDFGKILMDRYGIETLY